MQVIFNTVRIENQEIMTLKHRSPVFRWKMSYKLVAMCTHVFLLLYSAHTLYRRITIQLE